MISLSPWVIQKFTDDNDNPLALGSVHTYIAGSSTDAPSYSDVGGTLNTNPVALDSAGEANILLSDSYVYKFVVKNASGTTVRTIDDITPASVSSTSTAGSVSLIVSSFDRILSASDTDVQKAADTIDNEAALKGGEVTQDFTAKDLSGNEIFENSVSLIDKYAKIAGDITQDFAIASAVMKRLHAQDSDAGSVGYIENTGTGVGLQVLAAGDAIWAYCTGGANAVNAINSSNGACVLATNTGTGDAVYANAISGKGINEIKGGTHTTLIAINNLNTETNELLFKETTVVKGSLKKYGSIHATVAKRKHIVLENESIEAIDIDELGQTTVKEDATFEKDVAVNGFAAHGSGNTALKYHRYTGTTDSDSQTIVDISSKIPDAKKASLLSCEIEKSNGYIVNMAMTPMEAYMRTNQTVEIDHTDSALQGRPYYMVIAYIE